MFLIASHQGLSTRLRRGPFRVMMLRMQRFVTMSATPDVRVSPCRQRGRAPHASSDVNVCLEDCKKRRSFTTSAQGTSQPLAQSRYRDRGHPGSSTEGRPRVEKMKHNKQKHEKAECLHTLA